MIEDYVEWLNERNKLHFGTVDHMLAKCKAAMQAAKHDQVGCPPEPHSGVRYKPRLGLYPESVAVFVQNYERIGDILAAMTRYHEANKPFPLEWVDWLKQRVESQQRT
jgi:hypothetical protein